MTTGSFIIGATFTARPLEKLLKDGGAGSVSFTPYNQLVQWLICPPVLHEGETPVFLIRLADLVRLELGKGAPLESALAERVEDLIEALRAFCARHSGPKPWLLLAPSGDAALWRPFEERFRALDCVHRLAWADILAGVGNGRIFDPVADRLGHIPFAMDVFKVLAGEMLAKCSAAATAGPGSSPAAPALSDDLDRFLQKLRLKISCAPIVSAGQTACAAKLTHTVVYFHASGRRYTEETLGSALETPAIMGLSIEVSDRFGDYGATGFILAEVDEALVIKEFVLSCVVLGKQVEYCLIWALAESALSQGITAMVFESAELDSNKDATGFLDALCSAAEGRRNRTTEPNRIEFNTEKLRNAALVLAASKQAIKTAQISLGGGWIQRRTRRNTAS